MQNSGAYCTSLFQAEHKYTEKRTSLIDNCISTEVASRFDESMTCLFPRRQIEAGFSLVASTKMIQFIVSMFCLIFRLQNYFLSKPLKWKNDCRCKLLVCVNSFRCISPNRCHFALKRFLHYVAVLLFNVLSQFIFAKCFLMSLYLPLLMFSCTMYRIRSPFALIMTYIWLWSLHHSGSHIFTLSTIFFMWVQNYVSPLVGCNTCKVRKLHWSSLPVLCSDFHCICPWIKSPIIIQSRLLTSFIACYST